VSSILEAPPACDTTPIRAARSGAGSSSNSLCSFCIKTLSENRANQKRYRYRYDLSIFLCAGREWAESGKLARRDGRIGRKSPVTDSWFVRFLLKWPPYGIGQAIIFLPCDFYLYIFFFFFFSSTNLSGRRLDVYHISTHGVAFVRI